MYGTNEKFNLQRATFARSACAFYIFEDYYDHLLRLSNYKPSAMVLSSPFLFKLTLLADGTEVPYTYFSDAGSLRMDSAKGFAQFALTDQEQMRVRGKGVTLRIELCPAMKEMGTTACHGVRPLKQGAWEAVFGTYGKFLFKPLKGTVAAVCPWNEDKGAYDTVIFDLIPDDSGEFETAVHDDMTEFDVGSAVYPPFDALVQASLDSYEDFKKNYRKPAKGYETLFDYAVYQNWSHRTKASGGYKEPGIMFQCSIAGVFSWQQSYQGMAMLNNPKEAWRQICTLFLYQDERTGRLPSYISYVGGANAGIQPPFQGFAMDALIRRVGDSFLTPEECARMYPKFVKWLNYWLTTRSARRDDPENPGHWDDVTAINNPNDSGWDDASNFRDGFPAQNPDVIAFMIALMDMTARLARGCGKADEANSWKARSDRLLNILVTEFWDGEKFVTKVKGKPVDSMSVICYQPILLGDRLPQHIIDKIAETLTEEGNFLTEIGLATESLRSPLCDYSANTFIAGRVVAPPHMPITVGLNIAGKKKEAALIARRWCDNVKEKGIILGFAPYEYYKLTGEKANITPGPVASDGWSWSTWAACCTLTMITSIIPDAEEA
jgi:putative isomerase